MNPDYDGRFSGSRHQGFSRFPMGSPTPKRIAGLRATVKMPRRGPMTEYVRELAIVELLAHKMAGHIK